MSTPIARIMDGIAWTPADAAERPEGEPGIPFVTHSGTLTIAGFAFRCYQLNTGERVFDAGDLERFLEGNPEGEIAKVAGEIIGEAHP